MLLDPPTVVASFGCNWPECLVNLKAVYVVRKISPLSLISLKYGGAIELSTHFKVAEDVLSILRTFSVDRIELT